MFATSQSAADRIIHHLVPILAKALRPEPTALDTPWIIDETLIPVHDQAITAPAKNYRRSINTQIIICSPGRAVVAVGDCRPGNRHDVVVARHTVAHLLTGERVILGDGGYRGIDAITTPARDNTGRIIHDDLYQHTAASAAASNTSSPGSKLADPAAMPAPRPGHQPQPPHHHRALEPQNQSYTSRLADT